MMDEDPMAMEVTDEAKSTEARDLEGGSKCNLSRVLLMLPSLFVGVLIGWWQSRDILSCDFVWPQADFEDGSKAADTTFLFFFFFFFFF